MRSTVTHPVQQTREDGASRFLAALERLERIADRLVTGIDRIEAAEDRLDRHRRPYGDGRRH